MCLSGTQISNEKLTFIFQDVITNNLILYNSGKFIVVVDFKKCTV